MKLVVQIPCFNEEKTIAEVIRSVPKRIPGIKKISILVVDDGSTDDSVKNAKSAGADFILINRRNLGLANTFKLAIEKSLEMGADVIVNTDADNQYNQTEIRKLVIPVVDGEADIVIGDRQIKKLKSMDSAKKWGNILGSWAISRLTGVKINDASSGLRAFSKNAAKAFNLTSTHTYTHETIIQAIFKNLTIKEIPVEFKKRKYGSSRLISSIWTHIKYSLATIVRAVLMYKAFKYLSMFGLLMLTGGTLIGIRFMFFYFSGTGDGHTQSLILSSILISLGFNIILLGIIADQISINRRLIEEIKK